MRQRLAESDRLVEELSGSIRLWQRRRRGVLRHISGPDIGFPFFRPDLDHYRNREAPEPRIFKLADELEWVVVPGRTDANKWRPIKDELTFDEARAIAGMKAGTLYAHTAGRKVPGQICRQLGEELDKTTHGLRFWTEKFMAWALIVVWKAKKK